MAMQRSDAGDVPAWGLVQTYCSFFLEPPGGMTDEISNQQDSGPARRETSSDVLATRAARQLVRSVHKQLGSWQAESVKLEAIVERLRASGRHDPSVSNAAKTLLGSVHKGAREFEREVGKAPEPVRQHGRIADTRTVLRLVEQRVSATLNRMDDLPKR